MRLPLPDQRVLLEDEHQRHQQIHPRVLPYRPQRYGSGTTPSLRATVAGPFASQDWLIYEVVSSPSGGKRRLLHLSRAEELSRAFRGALIAAADGQLPEPLSGHAADGTSASRPHLAFVPLADVGHEWATGSILGIALVPPHDLSRNDHKVLLRALASLPDPLPLRPRRDITVWVKRITGPSHRQTLRESTWTGAARRWASVSALALDKNPGRLDSRDPDVVARAVEEAEQTLVQSCRNLGLPHPKGVFIHRRSLHSGAPAARRFMPYPRSGNGPRRVCVHAEIVFDVPIRGPLLLGAGRYFGLGLFRPVERGDGDG